MKASDKKEIESILENIVYWDSCPDEYKKRIPVLIESLKEEPINKGEDLNKGIENLTELIYNFKKMRIETSGLEEVLEQLESHRKIFLSNLDNKGSEWKHQTEIGTQPPKQN